MGMALVVRNVHNKEITTLPIVIQNDNSAVVDAINRGRAHNHAFAIILSAIAATTSKLGDHFVGAHLAGEHNTIADKLSRGRIEEARKESMAIFKRAVVTRLPKEAKPIVDAIQKAAQQALAAKARRDAFEKRKNEELEQRKGEKSAKKQRMAEEETRTDEQDQHATNELAN